MSHPARPVFRRRHAFTLIELLAVIAIVGILAAIIIPVTGKVRQTARRAECISNLRQIGVAIALATEDRKGRLPGPFFTGQGFPSHATYTAYVNPVALTDAHAGDGRYLYGRLDIYVGKRSPGENRPVPKLFSCPGYRAVSNVGASYLLPGGIDRTKGSFYLANQGFNKHYNEPFGYPSERSPMRLSDLHALSLGPSRLWAIIDSSKQPPGGLGSPSWAGGVPATPVHGRFANALFFDWHVGKIDSSGLSQ